MQRETKRFLLLDEAQSLVGWENTDTGQGRVVRETTETNPLAFSGIQVISPKLFEWMTDDPPFSIITAYLNASVDQGRVFGYQIPTDVSWFDIGTEERLEDFRAWYATH